MAGMQFKNNAVSSLAGAITNSQTTFSVAAGEGALFPAIGASEYFKACLIASNGDREIIKVTGLATDTFTVVRAQEGTTGLAFASGSRVELRVTAAEFEKFLNTDNMGAGSGIDADLLDGKNSSATPTNDTVALRNGSGDLYANDFVGAGLTLSGDADVSGNAAVTGNVAVGGALNEHKGADIASAATINLDTATGNLVDVTGTTTITAITLSEGRERTVRFTGALTLTHGSSLVLPDSTNITTRADAVAIFRGYAAGVVRCIYCSAAIVFPKYLEYRDEKASGTNGGSTTGGAWGTRTLNTEAADSGGIGSLAANRITLPEGVYEVDITAPAFTTAGHQARLYDHTNTAVLLHGTSQWDPSGTGATTRSHITGRITLASSTEMSVQHFVQSTKLSDGFGKASVSGGTEIYTVARFWKVG